MMEKKHLCTYFSIYYNTKSDTFKSEPNLMSTCSNLSLTFNMHMRKLNLPALLWYSWYRSIFLLEPYGCKMNGRCHWKTTYSKALTSIHFSTGNPKKLDQMSYQRFRTVSPLAVFSQPCLTKRTSCIEIGNTSFSF
jgi:hypothetical protein